MITATTPRMVSLRNPTKKMSKSDPDESSRIGLLDDPETVARKIRATVTDSIQELTWDPERRPGVSSLIALAAASSKPPSMPATLILEQQIKSIQQLKALAAENIVAMLSPIQERYHHFFNQSSETLLSTIAYQGAEKARLRASVTLGIMKQAMGLGHQR